MTYRKRVDVVTVKLVKERSISYAERRITSPKEAADLARGFIGESDRENLMVIGLNTKSEPTIIQIVSTGNISSSIVHPREIFKSLILSNAYCFILIHNHPSGYCEKSAEDTQVTKRIKEASNIMGIIFSDHIIISDCDYYSYKEEGYL